jgi:hypothetical protein
VYLNGDPRRAIQLADPVLETAEHLDLVPIVADTLITRGSALAQIGRSAEGLALLRAGQALTEKHGLSEFIMRAIGNRVGYETDLDPRSALEAGWAGLAVARRLGVRNPIVLGNTTWAAMRVGEWAWAVPELDGALSEEWAASDRSELLPNAIWFRAYMGEPTDELVAEIERLNAGETDVFRRAATIAARSGVDFAAGRLGEARHGYLEMVQVTGAGSVHTFAARAALWSRDLEAARTDLAGFDASGLHGPAPEADRKTIRAGIAALEGHQSDALGLYREALRDWQDNGLAWDEALCSLDMAQLLDPSLPEVRAAAESAREILVRLGARPFIQLLDEALAGATPEPTTAQPPAAVEAATPSA